MIIFSTFAPALVDIVILALAVLRVSYFLVAEKGPFAFMLRLRWWLKRPEVLTCINCASGWVTLALVPIYYLTPLSIGRWLVTWWAVWGLALVIRSYTGFGLGDSVQADNR